MFSVARPQEAERLQVLHALGVLDSEVEIEFSEIVQLAADICQVPIALISLVDTDRQWFKAKIGLAADETSREVSFCSHAIRRPDEVMVVQDASQDDRFRENDLVVGEPNIRFYAGAPVIVDDQPIGTVCVIDSKPRDLSPLESRLLQSLASHVSNLFRASAKVRVLSQANLGLSEFAKRASSERSYLAAVLNSTPNLVCVLDLDQNVIMVNHEWELMTGMVASHLIGRPISSFVVSQDDHETFNVAFEKIKSGERVVKFESRISTLSNGIRTLSCKIVRTSLIDSNSDVIVVSGNDITKLRKLEASLNEANAFRDAVLDSADMAIVATNNRGRIVTFSRGAENLLGYARTEMVGTRFNFEMFQPHEQSQSFFEGRATQRSVVDLLGSGTSWPRSWTCLNRSGERIPVDVSFRNIVSDEGKRIGFLTLIQDDRQRLEAERIRNESLERLKTLVNNLPACAILVEEDRLHFNDFVTRLTGFMPEEISTKHDWFHQLHPGRAEESEERFRRHVASGYHEPFFSTVMTKQGEMKTLEKAIFVGNGTEVWLLTDVTERLASQEALRKSEALFRTSHENLQSGVVVFDKDLHITMCNPKGVEILAQSYDQIIGKEPPDPQWGAVGEDGLPLEESLYPAVTVLRTGQIVQDFVHGLTLPRGGIKWISVNASPILDENGEVNGVVACFSDVTDSRSIRNQLEDQMRQVSDYSIMLELRSLELEVANRRLEALVVTDGLTGLLNHRTLHDRLHESLNEAQRTGGNLAVVMVDVDNFKSYNDTFGHPAGDEVLLTVGQILTKTARSYDIVARYGGEEFLIILKGAGRGLAVEAAERFRRAIAAHAWERASVTASFGVASLDLGIDTASNLIELADRALYQAKHQGKNRVVCHQTNAPQRSDLVA